jgi:hypothetical protein
VDDVGDPKLSEISQFKQVTKSLFSKPFTDKDKVIFREYLNQLRTECCERLVKLLAGDGAKYWIQYGRIKNFQLYLRWLVVELHAFSF